jgi:M6 family metalloprotease-like protein
MKKILVVIFWVFPICIAAAPHNGEIMSFKQPDGTRVDVKLYGTEYYIRAEGLDNYTVVRDKNTQWICYASLSKDSTELISSGIKYRITKDLVPKLKMNLNTPCHLDLSSKAIEHIILKNKKTFEGRSYSNYNTKSENKYLSGAVKGLCIVVDFSDEPGTLPVDEFVSFCNDMNYSNFGNNGSLRKYYYDISGGIIDYQNVVFGYFRAPKTFAEYDTMPIAHGAAEIMELALKWIDSKGFDFSTLSTNPEGSIMAINLMYTGIPKAWNNGMWWHQGIYSGFSADGVHSGSYNCSIAYSPLSMATIVHENGHMLFNWDDTYKYNHENGPDGIGTFDLMCNYGNAYSPVPPNPYFIINAGWGNVVDISNFNSIISDFAEDRTYYQYTNANDTNESFIFDNRSKTGRSSSIPDEGLTIWHIDQRGDNQTLHHQVYLVHANNNIMDTKDICFHSGLNSEFSDTTEPNSLFYDGNTSHLIVHDISTVADTMTYKLGPINPEPLIKFSYLNISDDNNLDGFPEPGESMNINMKAGNFGTVNFGNAVINYETVGTNSEFVTINTAQKVLDDIPVQENVAFNINITIAANTPLREVIALKFTISGEYDTSSFTKEFVIGKVIYMANQQVSTCSSIFYDQGGRTRNYSSRTDFTTTFRAVAAGYPVKAEFFSFDLEPSDICEYDYLNIYDGLSTSSPLIGTYCSNNSPGTIQSTGPSGALTFKFHSDGAVTGTGWEALISCSGINEMQNISHDNTLEIYPNPSPDNVFVKINSNTPQNLRLVIIDPEGRELFENTITDQKLIEIKRANIQNGVYYLQLWNENTLMSIKKLILL